METKASRRASHFQEATESTPWSERNTLSNYQLEGGEDRKPLEKPGLSRCLQSVIAGWWYAVRRARRPAPHPQSQSLCLSIKKNQKNRNKPDKKRKKKKGSAAPPPSNIIGPPPTQATGKGTIHQRPSQFCTVRSSSENYSLFTLRRPTSRPCPPSLARGPHLPARRARTSTLLPFDPLFGKSSHKHYPYNVIPPPQGKESHPREATQHGGKRRYQPRSRQFAVAR